MNRLSSPATEMRDRYEVVVVGSGYGGAIAASRLSRAGRKVCLLERGKEFLPGEYPDTLLEASDEYQVDAPEGHFGSRSALYDLRVNPDINVFKGCGLGGTSLVNANVAITVEDRVFDDARWPAALRGKPGELERGYTLARRMLGSNPYPDSAPKLHKLEAHAKSAAALGIPFTKVPINVTFKDGLNAAGVMQSACTLCGDCVSGCNYGAKNNLRMNYLPDAKNWGAEVFTCVDVSYLEKQGDRWLVHYQLLEAGREAFDAPTQFVEADMVVLAGGSLGSTEILLRSRAKGLSVSPTLGHGFSGNGDALGFGYNDDVPIDGIGWGERESDHVAGTAVGPCITSTFDLRNQPNLDDGMILEEGSVPGLLREIVTPTLALAADTIGEDTDSGVLDAVQEWGRRTLSLVTHGRHGAIRNTQTYLIMTHDGSDGTMALENDRLRLHWAGVGDRPIFARANDLMKRATGALGGTHVRNPIWSKLTHHELVTVHPLGGCCMADSAEQGTVNHLGQVYSAANGNAVYDNLLVCDGAIVPRSLGANPLLTISALAERNVELVAKSRGWAIDYADRAIPGAADSERPGVQFTETMKGFISFGAKDFQDGYERGKSAGTPFAFTLTIRTNDVDAMLGDPEHRAEMSGTVAAPSLSPLPITVTEGEFQLFNADPDRSRAKQMRYRMKLTTEEGRTFSFSGFKEVQDDAGFDLWADTTTLYITIEEQGGAAGTAKGVLRIELADFMKQVRTMRALNAKNTLQRAEVLARFGGFFMGELYNTYGGIVATSSVHDPDAPPRKMRSLRIPPPELVGVTTEDGVALKLTRHRAGGKGPVLLAPGMGTSTRAFTLDTIDVNLAEYLSAHGYDIWLFDYRASSELAVSRSQFSMDEIARYDYPAAIAKVREITGAASVQVVAHCVASASLFLSLLGGHAQNVRSFVASQFMPIVESTPLVELKSKLRLPALLQAFGVDVLSTEFDTKSSFKEQAYDALLRLYPAAAGQLCDIPVCRRIRFMWGEVFQHENLNHATHLAIHELFGDGNLTLFKHLAAVVRAGKLVDHDEKDVYLPHLDRLKLPISILQGRENTLFLPSASQRFFELLVQTNGAANYTRKEFPGYAHMDSFIGKTAAADVFPHVLAELERYN